MDGGEARYHQLKFIPLMKSPATKRFRNSPPPVVEEESHSLEGVPPPVSLLGVPEHGISSHLRMEHVFI
jgi:hypothetical protein